MKMFDIDGRFLKCKRGWYVLALLLVSCIPLSAQVRQTHRFEMKQKNSDDYFSLINLEEEGLALLRETDDFNGPARIWELILLDTALNEHKNIGLEIHQRHQLIGYEHSKDHLFLLYRTGETTKNSFSLLDIEISTAREVARKEINPELDFRLTHFTKVAGNLIFGGYVSNEPAVLLYDMDTNQLKVLPGFFQKDNELVDLRVNQNRTFNAILVDRSLRNQRKLVFRTFDETGKLLLEDIVPIDEDRTLQTSIASTLEREDLLLAGTWGERQGRQSYGFFAMPVDPFSEQKINYLSFGELEHFTDYLNPKRAQRIKDNARESVANGRDPSFSAYVVPFRIAEHPEGFLLLAEVYNPSHTANPYYSNPYYSNPYYYNPYSLYSPFWPGYYPGMRMYRPYSFGDNQRPPEDIKTHESMVVAFDPDGKRIWDQSIQLDDLKKPGLEQVTDYFYSDSKVYFMYKDESDLHIKVIDVHDGSAVEQIQKVKTELSNDEIRSDREHDDGVRYWIGNTFYVWGYQTIRNVEKKDDRVRDVFYINKVVAR